MTIRALIFVLIAAAASPAFAQAPDKSEYSLVNPAPRKVLRELSTDRPDKTESPFTVDAGRIQIEMDLLTHTRDVERSAGEDIRTEMIGVAPFNLKLGLTNSTDMQLLVEPYVRQTVTNRTTGVRDRRSGVGDVTIRLKHNLWGNDGGRTALALMPFVTLPVGDKGIGSGAAGFGLIVPLAIEVADGIGIGLMTEIDMLDEADGDGYAATLVFSATIGVDLTDRLGAYVELFTERSTERGAQRIVTGDVGLTYALTDDFQLDGGVNLGITRAADDLQLFVGVSRRF